LTSTFLNLRARCCSAQMLHASALTRDQSAQPPARAAGGRATQASQRRPQRLYRDGALVLVARAPADDQHDRLSQPVLRAGGHARARTHSHTQLIVGSELQLASAVVCLQGEGAKLPASSRCSVHTSIIEDLDVCQCVLISDTCSPLAVSCAAPSPPWHAPNLTGLHGAQHSTMLAAPPAAHGGPGACRAHAMHTPRTLSTGLDRKPSMPAARHSSRSRSLALAVMATIGSAMPARRITCAAGVRQTLLLCRPRDLASHLGAEAASCAAFSTPRMRRRST